jgi:hypothetical protein
VTRISRFGNGAGIEQSDIRRFNYLALDPYATGLRAIKVQGNSACPGLVDYWRGSEMERFCKPSALTISILTGFHSELQLNANTYANVGQACRRTPRFTTLPAANGGSLSQVVDRAEVSVAPHPTAGHTTPSR